MRAKSYVVVKVPCSPGDSDFFSPRCRAVAAVSLHHSNFGFRDGSALQTFPTGYGFFILKRTAFFIVNNNTHLRPEMTLTRIKTMATTRRTWIKPPIVVLVTSPST